MLPRLKNKVLFVWVLFLSIFYYDVIFSNLAYPILIFIIPPLVFIPLGIIHRSDRFSVDLKFLSPLYYNLDPINESSNTVEQRTGDDSNLSNNKNYRRKAEKSLEKAVDAVENNELETATEAYNRAISQYQAALDELPTGATAKRKEIKNEIESTRSDVEKIQTRNGQQSRVADALQPAERSFQEAIIALAEDNQTIARIRFRQARDTFGEAIETIEKSDTDLLSPPIEVSANPDQELSSTTLSKLTTIPEDVVTPLGEAGIKTIRDLDARGEPPWTPSTVAEIIDMDSVSEDIVTTLTVLSWWHNDDEYNFDTTEKIVRRQQQADYGFDRAT
jgi:tetratricopeptide (TPR) repeat protein